MESYDAIIVGAGPAGLSAALYLAKGGLSVLMLGDGRSAMNTAWLEGTYLGVVEPTHGLDFLAMGIQQAEQLGVRVVQEKALSFTGNEDGTYRLSTKGGGEYQAEYVLFALGNSVATAHKFGLELEESDEPHTLHRIKTDSRGRTALPKVYAAGVVSGIISQAIIAAGHGAEVALNLLTDRAGTSVYFHETVPKDKRRS